MAVLKVIAIITQLKLYYHTTKEVHIWIPVEDQLPSMPSCDHQVTFCTFLY